MEAAAEPAAGGGRALSRRCRGASPRRASRVATRPRPSSPLFSTLEGSPLNEIQHTHGAFLHILLGSNLVTASQLGQRRVQAGQNSLANLILDLNEPLHKFKDLLSWFSKYMDLDETSVQVQGPTVDFTLFH